jgi:hypothetical protein
MGRRRRHLDGHGPVDGADIEIVRRRMEWAEPI